MIRLLIVDDESSLARHIAADLTELDDSYEIKYAETCEEALSYPNCSFDVILLDIMLPDANGIDICPVMRERQNCPILFISCLDDSDSIVHAFEQGGDDYVCKPFDSKVLHARIQANLRRVCLAAESREPSPLAEDYEFNEMNYSILFKGERISLLPIEFRILSFLIKNSGNYYKSKEIYQIVWGADSFGDIRTVHVHIHNIRKKLHDDPDNPQIIRNERGKGYTFVR